jgi:hypothetical protein
MSDDGNLSPGLLSSPRLPDQSAGSSVSTSMQVMKTQFYKPCIFVSKYLYILFKARI